MSSLSSSDRAAGKTEAWTTTESEIRILQAVQATVGSRPQAIAIARSMSHFGEHALGWAAIGGVGALVDRGQPVVRLGQAVATHVHPLT